MDKFSPQILSTLPYTIVERFIENFEQKRKAHQYTLHLEHQAIISNSHHFSLDDVLDITYKKFSSGDGHLYLHTIQGVFAFVISKDPRLFIESYRQLKK